jgi:hypothetical protein
MIFAQPLYIRGVRVNGVAKNLIVVATRENKVYAFDADDLNPEPDRHWVWLKDFKTTLNAKLGRYERAGFIPDQLPDLEHQREGLTSPRAGCGEQRGPVGITSTPVIDPQSGTLYVVVRASDFGGGSSNDNPVYVLHALSIDTGADKPNSPVEITFPGLNPRIQQNRAALLLSHGNVYIAFGSLACDHGAFHGFLVGYNATTLARLPNVFNTTPNRDGGGAIWQSGNGPAADAAGNIYFLTGNPNVPKSCVASPWSLTNLGNSLVRINADLSSTSVRAVAPTNPVEWRDLACGDVDVGSGGPLLLPGERLVGGGKQGKLYVIDTQTFLKTQEFQAFQNYRHPEIPPANYQNHEKCGPNIHVGPVFLHTSASSAGQIYAMPEKERLEVLPYDGATVGAPNRHGEFVMPDGMPGAALSLSSDRGSHPIVWASMPKTNGQWSTVAGRLVAYDAESLSELWRDDDDVAYAKFVPPTVADSKVFRATAGDELIVYGLVNQPSPPPCDSIEDKYRAGGGIWAFGTKLQNAPVSNAAGDARWQDFAGDLSVPLIPDIARVRPSLGDIGTSRIYWTAAACAHPIIGDILLAWNGHERELAFPTGDEQEAADSTTTFQIRVQQFRNGAIFWYWRHPNDLDCNGRVPVPHEMTMGVERESRKAVEVHGRIYQRWQELDPRRWEQFAPRQQMFGYPVSNEIISPKDNRYRYNEFEFGRVYFRQGFLPDTLEIHGAIFVKFRSHDDQLGLPISDETDISDKDGRQGRVNYFASGAVVWTRPNVVSPDGGAFEVHGEIYKAWSGQTREQLGFPTSDELATPSGALNHFANGDISWERATGRISIARR